MMPLDFNLIIKFEVIDRKLQYFLTFTLNLRFLSSKICLMAIFIGLYPGEL